MPLTIYHRGATRSIRNIWLCEELVDIGAMKREDFKVIDVPDPFPPEFAKIHPGMRIPAADFDGDVIFESGAILEYTLELYGKGSLQGTKAERPYYLQWLHFAETSTQGARTPTVLGKFPGSENWSFQDARDETMSRVINGFSALEQNLANQDYMLKSGFSAVDIQTLWGLNAYFRILKIVDAKQFPKLAAYVERCTARPAYKRAWEYRKPDPNRQVLGKAKM